MRSYEAQGKKGNFTYSLYFLLGKNILMDEIYQEQEKYGDIIVGNFLDSYDNLPIKTFMAFQFFANNCYWKKKKMLILQDTDCFISGNAKIYILSPYDTLTYLTRTLTQGASPPDPP